MKKTLLIILGFVLFGVTVQAQILNPIKWSFSASPVKGKAGMYEIHMTANIDKGWTTYSQTTPEGGPAPTLIKFKPNANVLLGGKVKEVGEMKKKHEAAFGVDVHYYATKVDFVQVVKVKKSLSPRKGDLSQKERGVVLKGTVEFMACDATQCLPPEEVPFEIELK